MSALLERVTRLPKRAADLVLLRQAESRAKALGDEQRQRVRLRHQAALRRILAARGLRDANDVVAAGTLYREAGHLAALTVIATQDADANLDLDAKAAWERLEQLLPESAELEAAKKLTTSGDLLAVDALPPVRAREELDQIDRALSRLLGTVEPRTVKRIRISRILRIALVALVLLGSLIGLLAWLLAPTNVAKGKPASAISYWPGSAPAEELVDGEKEAPWGSATGRAVDAWFQVDLLSKYDLSKIAVVNRDDEFSSTTVPFVIEVSEDGTTFSEIARFEGSATGGQRWVHKGGGHARFVRVRRVGGTGFALSEIEVYGKKL